MCVQRPGNNTALGTRPTLATCGTGAEQVWGLSGGHVAANSTRCLSVFGGQTNPGATIGIWDGCFATPPVRHAQFTIFGEIKGLGGQCIHRQGGLTDGSVVGMQPCQINGVVPQSWETYF